MSRIANSPVSIPAGVAVEIDGQNITVKGPKGTLYRVVHERVGVIQTDTTLRISARDGSASSIALAGTTRALLNNMVIGVAEGFMRRLLINGVGYRAQLQGSKLNLTLGYSHPVEVVIPEGITIETPTQTEIVVRGTDKQRVGQISANIRAFRKPEPYKGKGIRYSDEQIRRKEAKKT